MGNRYYPVNGKELASVTTITGLADKSDALIRWAVNCAVDFIKGRSDYDGEMWYIVGEDDFTDARTEWRTVRDEAGHIGTMVHDALEEYLHGHGDLIDILQAEIDHPDPVVVRCAEMANSLIRAAVEKLEALGPYTVLATEQKVVNENEWYAGRFDLLIEVEVPHAEKWEGREVSTTVKETWLIDFKTGASFYPEWGMQLAAYAEAWEDDNIGKFLDDPQYDDWPKIDRIKVLRLDKKTLKAYWKEYGGEKDALTRENYMTAFRGLRDAFYVLKAKKAVKLAWLAR
jgi:hypothetical protein